MNLSRDENLLRDQELHRAVAASHTVAPAPVRSRHSFIWGLVGSAMIGLALIVLISLIRLAG